MNEFKALFDYSSYGGGYVKYAPSGSKLAYLRGDWIDNFKIRHGFGNIQIFLREELK